MRRATDPFLQEKYRVTVDELAEYLGVSKAHVYSRKNELGIKGQFFLSRHGGRREELTTPQAQRVIDHIQAKRRNRKCKNN